MKPVLILIMSVFLLTQCGLSSRGKDKNVMKNIRVTVDQATGFKKTEVLDASGAVKKQFTHNKQDELITLTFYTDEGKPEYSHEFDHSGNKTRELTYLPDGSVASVVVFIYQEGKKVKEEKRSPDNELLEYSEIDYYENGYKREVRNFDSKGLLINSFEFGEEDQLIRSNEYYPNGKRKLSYELILNKDVEKIIRYNPAGDKKIYEYKNDEKRLIQTFFNQSGIIVNSMIFDYGGKQLAKADYDESGKIIYFYQYLYDSSGKIEKVITVDVSGDLVDYF